MTIRIIISIIVRKTRIKKIRTTFYIDVCITKKQKKDAHTRRNKKRRKLTSRLIMSMYKYIDDK